MDRKYYVIMKQFFLLATWKLSKSELSAPHTSPGLHPKTLHGSQLNLQDLFQHHFHVIPHPHSSPSFKMQEHLLEYLSLYHHHVNVHFLQKARVFNFNLLFYLKSLDTET